MLSKEMFIMGISSLAELLGAEMSEPALDLYYSALSDLDDTAFQQAVERAARECRFMPKPSEIRDLGGEHKPNERAIAAWMEATTAVRRHGMYESVCFDDPAINAAVRSLGGWSRFCTMPTEEAERFARRDFERAYVAFARRDGLSEEFAAYLPGIAEQHNASLGLATKKPPVRIEATSSTLIAARVKALEGKTERVTGGEMEETR